MSVQEKAGAMFKGHFIGPTRLPLKCHGPQHTSTETAVLAVLRSLARLGWIKTRCVWPRIRGEASSTTSVVTLHKRSQSPGSFVSVVRSNQASSPPALNGWLGRANTLRGAMGSVVPSVPPPALRQRVLHPCSRHVRLSLLPLCLWAFL